MEAAILNLCLLTFLSAVYTVFTERMKQVVTEHIVKMNGV